MGIFNRTAEEKEAVRQAETHKALDKFGLDLESYSVEDIKKRNVKNLKNVAYDLFANKVTKIGMALSFAKQEVQAKVAYLNALVEQNWILIRQNELIIKELSNLAGQK